MRYIMIMYLTNTRFVFLFALALIFISINSAHAQSTFYETRQYSLSSEKVFDLPPPEEIDRAFLREMDTVYRECETDYYDSGHRDCRCYAMSYLEERLKYKSLGKEDLKIALRQVCMDTERMKGFYFGKCAGKIDVERLISKNKNPTEVCECYANKVPELILQGKAINAKTMQTIRKSAHITCGLD